MKKESFIIGCLLLALLGFGVFTFYQWEKPVDKLKMLCGVWESTDSSPALTIMQEGENYWIVTTTARENGQTTSESFPLRKEDCNGVTFFNDTVIVNLFYTARADVLLVLPHYGSYTRKRHNPFRMLRSHPLPDSVNTFKPLQIKDNDTDK